MNYQSFYKQRSQRSEVASIINPNPGIRGEMALRGQTPKDHAKDNYRKMKALEDQAQRKKEEEELNEVLKENKWKMNKFKNVESKVRIPKASTATTTTTNGAMPRKTQSKPTSTTQKVLTEKNLKRRDSGAGVGHKQSTQKIMSSKTEQLAMAGQMDGHALKIVTYDPETGDAQEEQTDFIKANLAQYDDQMSLNEKMNRLHFEGGAEVDDEGAGGEVDMGLYEDDGANGGIGGIDGFGGEVKQRKPAVPRAGEMNRLAARTDKNYVTSNQVDAIASKSKRPTSSADKESKKKHQSYGKVPKYLEKYNQEAERERERLRLEEEQKDIPAGTRLLSAEEVHETLENLKKSRQDLFLALEKLPIANVTRAVENKKKGLEEKIKEVDRAIDLFSRPKVYVQAD